MKKIIAIILVLSLVLSLTACGGTATETTVPTVTPTVAPTTAPTTAPTVTPTETPEVEESGSGSTTSWVSLPSGSTTTSSTKVWDGESEITSGSYTYEFTGEESETISLVSDTFTGTLTISGTTTQNLEINMPYATINFSGTTTGTVDVISGQDTFNMKNGASAKKVIISGGNAVIESGAAVGSSDDSDANGVYGIEVAEGNTTTASVTIKTQEKIDVVVNASTKLILEGTPEVELTVPENVQVTIDVSNATPAEAEGLEDAPSMVTVASGSAGTIVFDGLDSDGEEAVSDYIDTTEASGVKVTTSIEVEYSYFFQTYDTGMEANITIDIFDATATDDGNGLVTFSATVNQAKIESNAAAILASTNNSNLGKLYLTVQFETDKLDSAFTFGGDTLSYIEEDFGDYNYGAYHDYVPVAQVQYMNNGVWTSLDVTPSGEDAYLSTSVGAELVKVVDGVSELAELVYGTNWRVIAVERYKEDWDVEYTIDSVTALLCNTLFVTEADDTDITVEYSYFFQYGDSGIKADTTTAAFQSSATVDEDGKLVLSATVDQEVIGTTENAAAILASTNGNDLGILYLTVEFKTDEVDSFKFNNGALSYIGDFGDYDYYAYHEYITAGYVQYMKDGTWTTLSTSYTTPEQYLATSVGKELVEVLNDVSSVDALEYGTNWRVIANDRNVDFAVTYTKYGVDEELITANVVTTTEATVSTVAELTAALEIGGNILVKNGTYGATDANELFVVDALSYITAESSDAVIYGSFVVTANGSSIDGLTIMTQGGGATGTVPSGYTTTAFKAAINLVCYEATITNCTITMHNVASGNVANGITIWPYYGTSSETTTNFVVDGNTINNFTTDVTSWSSGAITVAENISLARFNISEKSSKLNITTDAEYAIAAGNTYVDCTYKYQRILWTDAETVDEYGVTVAGSNFASYGYVYIDGSVSRTSNKTMNDGSTVVVLSGATLTYSGDAQLKGTGTATVIVEEGATVTGINGISGAGTYIYDTINETWYHSTSTSGYRVTMALPQDTNNLYEFATDTTTYNNITVITVTYDEMTGESGVLSQSSATGAAQGTVYSQLNIWDDTKATGQTLTYTYTRGTSTGSSTFVSKEYDSTSWNSTAYMAWFPAYTVMYYNGEEFVALSTVQDSDSYGTITDKIKAAVGSEATLQYGTSEALGSYYFTAVTESIYVVVTNEATGTYDYVIIDFVAATT